MNTGGSKDLCDPDLIRFLEERVKLFQNSEYRCSYFSHSINDLAGTATETLRPNVFVWDPIKQLGCNFHCPHCYTDTKYFVDLSSSNEMTFFQNESRKPRKIWDVNWFAIIVGTIYVCKNSHRIISYHAGLLQQIPAKHIPFILTHDSGMSVHLFDSLIRMVEIGTSFASIQKFVKDKYLDTYMRRKMIHCTEFPLVQCDFDVLCPSIDTIIQCFLFHFEKHETMYCRHFSNVSFSSLSMDHTFKIAANIGVFRNGKWQKLYDSLFIILTEKGLVKKFKFTKGTSMEHLQDIFIEIASQNSYPNYIFVDNCCHVKNILNKYFPKSSVKLDTFHAVQRLTKFMPKRHPLYSEAVKTVGLVFRNSSDMAYKRTLPSPSPSIIMSNLNNFLHKWKDIRINEWKLFNSKVLKEFDNLKIHIEKGCLSFIPVGMGTNNNEALHRVIKQFGRSRLSVFNARAIISHLFYAKNSRILGHNITPPIWSQFAPCTNSFKPIIKADNTIQELTMYHLEDMQIDDDETLLDHDYSCQMKIANIIQLASLMQNISSKIPRDLTAKFYRFQGFTTLPLSINFHQYFLMCCEKQMMDVEVITSLLWKMGYTVDIDKSRDTLDVLVWALREVHADENVKTYSKEVISSILKDNPKENLKYSLRDEILGHEYQSLNEECVDSEDFFNSEKYFSHIIFATCCLFGFPIIIIPNVFQMPMFPAMRKDNLVNHPVFLLFDSESKKLLPIYENKCPSTLHVVCYCGQKGGKAQVNCYQNFSCSCLKKNKSCSVQCRCRECGNNKPENQSKNKRRKRITHEMNSSQLSSLQYALMINELSENFITTTQHFLLEAILFLFLENHETCFVDLDMSEITEDIFQQHVLLCNDIQLKYENKFVDELLQLEKSSIAKWVNLRKKKTLLLNQLVE